MPSFSLNLSENVDLNTLVRRIGNVIGKSLNTSNFSRQKVGGGVFVSTIRGNEIVAAFYHGSKYHSAFADGGVFGGGSVRSSCAARKWAVATTSAGITGRKTYYGFS